MINYANDLFVPAPYALANDAIARAIWVCHGGIRINIIGVEEWLRFGLATDGEPRFGGSIPWGEVYSYFAILVIIHFESKININKFMVQEQTTNDLLLTFILNLF